MDTRHPVSRRRGQRRAPAHAGFVDTPPIMPRAVLPVCLLYVLYAGLTLLHSAAVDIAGRTAEALPCGYQSIERVVCQG